MRKRKNEEKKQKLEEKKQCKKKSNNNDNRERKQKLYTPKNYCSNLERLIHIISNIIITLLLFKFYSAQNRNKGRSTKLPSESPLREIPTSPFGIQKDKKEQANREKICGLDRGTMTARAYKVNDAWVRRFKFGD